LRLPRSTDLEDRSALAIAEVNGPRKSLGPCDC
jgi:hypothetical protein